VKDFAACQCYDLSRFGTFTAYECILAIDDQHAFRRSDPLPHRFLSLEENEILHGLDLGALFETPGVPLSLAQTSARLPEGLHLDDDGILSGLVPFVEGPITLLLRARDQPGSSLRALEIMVRSPFGVECSWRGQRLRLRVTKHLLHDVADLALTYLALGSEDILQQVQTDRLRLTATPSGEYHLDRPLRRGVTYLLSYDILQLDGPARILLAGGAGGPLSDGALPVCCGTNRVYLTPQKPIDGVLFATGESVRLDAVCCRQAEWFVDIPSCQEGDSVIWHVQSGSQTKSGTVQPRSPGALYVSPEGEDQPHRGGPDTPFRDPGYAARYAQPGDTIYLRPGMYPPFVVSRSGTPGAPITFTTLPGEEHQAIISAAGDTSFRLAGVLIEGQDHIIIKNLTIEDMLLSGIFVLGIEGERHGHHLLSGNIIRRTGNAGIFVAGYLPHQTLDYDDVRTIDVIIEGNDVSQTNIPTEYNNFKGGVNECISVAAGVDTVITRYNRIHDSRQYGIDYKLGVRNGKIYGNRIWHIARYGIYLDAARRYVENIDVFNNEIFRCGLGITLAREAVTDHDDPVQMADLVQTLRNINIYNNVIYDIERTGIYCHDHPKDRPEGVISEIRIRFNTVVNCATSGVGNEVRLVGWTKPDWDGILDDFDFVGNILWRADGPRTQSLFDTFSGALGVNVGQNLIGIDPQFTDLTGFHTAADSPARGLVDARFAGPPFNTTFAGRDRRSERSAGAFF